MDFPDHSQQLLLALRSQRQRGFLCDCTVMVGSTQFQAHRAVLAACSPFFNMFYSDSAEGNSTGSCVTLDSDIVTSAAFGLLLDFIYEGVLQLEGSSPVEDILAAASFLHMNSVVRVFKRRIHKRGPLAEADSTRCEQNSGLETAREQRREDGGQPSVELNQTSTQSQLRASDKSQCKGGFLKAELADTTQPGMDGPHAAIREQELTDAQRVEAQDQKEPPSLCSPCSTTGPNSLHHLNHQFSSSSSLVPSPPVGPGPGSSLSSTAQQSKKRSREEPMLDSAPPPIRINSAVSLQGHSVTFEPSSQEPVFKERDGEEVGVYEQVKSEAIVISDEELDDEKLPVMEVEEDYTDTHEEASSPHVLSCNPLGLLNMVSLSNDYTFPLSPPSSSSPGAPPSDPPPFMQSIHDNMGNFIKDVPTCGVCGKTFVCSYTLRRHAIVHTRARPYECRYCNRTYTQSGDLYRHVRKTHDHTLPARRSKADVQPAAPDTS